MPEQAKCQSAKPLTIKRCDQSQATFGDKMSTRSKSSRQNGTSQQRVLSLPDISILNKNIYLGERRRKSFGFGRQFPSKPGDADC
jgi:hypothetical protein